jgi:hypothetical protein
MIGRKVSDMCLDGKKLQFYQWGEGADVKALLEKVRIKVSIALPVHIIFITYS